MTDTALSPDARLGGALVASMVALVVRVTAAVLPARLVPLALQFMAYVLVSASALVVDFSLYWLMLKIVRTAALAASFGYVVGVLTHYALSSRIVFKDRLAARGAAAEAPVLAKFFVAGASGLAVTALTVGLLADGLGVSPIVAKICASGLSFVTVFSALRIFVFAVDRRHTNELRSGA